MIDAKVPAFPCDHSMNCRRATIACRPCSIATRNSRAATAGACSCRPIRAKGRSGAASPAICIRSPRRSASRGSGAGASRLVLDQKIPPVEAFEKKQTDYVRYLRIRSERLSKFWGRDIFLAAWVRLPWGFEEHPDARYPLVIAHGHFPAEPDGFRETPPDPDLKPEYSKRFRLEGYNRIQQEYAWQSHQDWITPGFPRVLLVEIQHPTPFYDDSYAVNSANNGPYGDAIQYELIPEIEKRFRGLGAGWSRFVYGGSTGGWEAMAVQMFYPDDYNGAWIACPDPIDFRHYELVNIYKDKNAYFTRNAVQAHPASRASQLARPRGLDGSRSRICTRLTLGTHGRSGDQWDAWESVYSPVGPDGYPRRIWDRETGEIDPVTAAYWREHYDLAHILRARLGDTRAEASRKTPHLCRGHGQLLPQQRCLWRRGVPEERGSAGRSGRRIRRSSGALLERRPHACECLFAAALSADGSALGRRADSRYRAAGSGHRQLALLNHRQECWR